jgi:hypothetical protein
MRPRPGHRPFGGLDKVLLVVGRFTSEFSSHFPSRFRVFSSGNVDGILDLMDCVIVDRLLEQSKS